MRIEIKDLEGRDHFVVPMVMITEGVHNGSHGPIFYSANELSRSVKLWDGKPIVVYHPDLMLSNGFAANPTVFNRQKVGTIFNTQFQANKLKADAWIDVERVRRVDERVLNTIQQQKMMEVSTGLSFPPIINTGIWKGEQYDMVATNLLPDHLAILPDMVGACSIADGAGLIRNVHFGMEPLGLPVMTF